MSGGCAVIAGLDNEYTLMEESTGGTGLGGSGGSSSATGSAGGAGGLIEGTCEGGTKPQPEVCNGADDDCNGTVDEGCPCTNGAEQSCYSGDPSTRNKGECRDGAQICASGSWGSCEGSVLPSDETCDSKDNNCDGSVDESVVSSCYAGPAGTTGVGACKSGTQTCSNGAWGACVDQVLPSDETCNQIDDDCDNAIDEDTSGVSCNTGFPGICEEGKATCADGELLCDPINEPAAIEDHCNGLDDDCDGEVDECFAGGTLITMSDGTTRAIEHVNIGDWVLAYDTAREQVVPAPVVRTFVHPVHEKSASLVQINGNLRATTNHPFYVNGRWVPAGQLHVGDALLLLSSDRDVSFAAPLQASVLSLSIEGERETTFNLEVASYHSYFAGGLLVHNKSICP